MSTSLLYRAFGIDGYHYVNTSYQPGRILFTIRQRKLRCPQCGSTAVSPHGHQERHFKTVPIGGKPVIVILPIPRVECTACGVTRQAKLHFADPRRSYTRAFERYALDLLRFATIQDVAKHLQVGWDLIKDIQKRYLARRFSRPSLKNLHQLAIDEIAVAKGHRYLTVVLNLGTGAVVFVGDGKGAASLKPFWKRLRRARAKVEAVAIDMSPAYIEAVRDNLPGVAIVFDHFHVSKLFNDKLSGLRRLLQRQAALAGKDTLKGVRWLLLKNLENLDPKRNEQERLQEALQLNQPLATAYYMKEELRLFWKQKDKQSATVFLDGWMARATASGVRMLNKFAKTLGNHRDGLLAYFDHRISTGPLEGTNNKIKTMKRQAYGFRDLEFFKLKILGLHETKYALVG